MATAPTPQPPVLSEDEQEQIREINRLTHFEMCRLWRFAPPGHPWFITGTPAAEAFKDRLFVHFHGFTAEISKALAHAE